MLLLATFVFVFVMLGLAVQWLRVRRGTPDPHEYWQGRMVWLYGAGLLVAAMFLAVTYVNMISQHQQIWIW